MIMITTLEQLRDYINSQEDWSPDIEDIIEQNGWESETGMTYGVCSDGKRRIELNSEGEAEIIDINPIDDRERLGLRLMEIRKLKKMSQQEVADIAGITRYNLSRIECGRYNVSIDILSRVCSAVGASLAIETEKATH